MRPGVRWLFPIMLAVVPMVVGRPRAPRPDRDGATIERQILDREIEWFRGRIERDPSGGLDYIQLGTRLMRRARESGQPADYADAAAAARAAIGNQPRHSAGGWQLLVAPLMNQHRF